MQRWRYHSLVIRDLSICEAKLNSEGEQGWELVSIVAAEGNAARAFFKMPVESGGSTLPLPPAHAQSENVAAAYTAWPGAPGSESRDEPQPSPAFTGANPFESD